MAAYYNEFDPAAAAWLSALMSEGHIAAGDIDTRSIKDVSPDDLVGYDQCHFFAGIGVWSHALRRAGWEDDRPIWTGSCPCQPFSAAGKGLGFADPRHLWPDFFRLIAERRPDCVLGEQAATAGQWIDLVRADLEGLGYAFGSPDIPAAGFAQGAHIRQRLYWVADADPAERWADMAPRHLGDWPAAGRVEGYGEPGAGGEDGGVADPHPGGQPQQPERYGRAFGGLEPPCGGDPLRRGQHDGVGLPEGEQWDGPGEAWGGRGQSPDAGSVDGLGHHHHPGLSVGSGGPDERGALRVEGPAFGASGSLLGCDWLLCHDARIRPVEAGTFPLAPTSPARVGLLRGYGNALDAETATNFIGAFMDAREEARLLAQMFA